MEIVFYYKKGSEPMWRLKMDIYICPRKHVKIFVNIML